ncbi:MAG: hypothetical protein A2V67_12720 [Deltaproteobacteria bacterium RBG_13_61_14]|nr:MAG: hypothetical protein A2V67_12720 [Deltaproteobacteria bacterium RBG_13_61_14]
MLDSKINSKFSLARFKMWERQVNGGINDQMCETLYNGAPYSSASSGEQILVGLDIISTLQEHHGIKSVLWLDHYEALSSPIKMDCQTICLQVSDDKKLTVELI